MSFQATRFRLTLLLLALPILLVGCSRSNDQTPTVATETTVPVEPREVLSADYEFEPAVRILADGEPIAVEKPGFACPTLFDFDDDGVDDLVVGQFADGKMKWYRNLAAADQTPQYAAGEWVSSGDSPAEVPGVS